jgi:hypothetical protein
MTRLSSYFWEIAAGLFSLALVILGVLLLTRRKRPSPEEVERERRHLLVAGGRIVDGTLLDVYEIDGEQGRTLPMLLFSYRIGGVDYECAQDISALSGIVDTAQIQAGFPCSVRYQPGNPQNSIVVAENWSGMRTRPSLAPLAGRSLKSPARALNAKAGEPQPHL